MLELPKDETADWVARVADAGIKAVWIHQQHRHARGARAGARARPRGLRRHLRRHVRHARPERPLAAPLDHASAGQVLNSDGRGDRRRPARRRAASRPTAGCRPAPPPPAGRLGAAAARPTRSPSPRLCPAARLRLRLRSWFRPAHLAARARQAQRAAAGGERLELGRLLVHLDLGALQRRLRHAMGTAPVRSCRSAMSSGPSSAA